MNPLRWYRIPNVISFVLCVCSLFLWIYFVCCLGGPRSSKKWCSLIPAGSYWFWAKNGCWEGNWEDRKCTTPKCSFWWKLKFSYLCNPSWHKSKKLLSCNWTVWWIWAIFHSFWVTIKRERQRHFFTYFPFLTQLSLCSPTFSVFFLGWVLPIGIELAHEQSCPNSRKGGEQW